jgi:hypothetical protein
MTDVIWLLGYKENDEWRTIEVTGHIRKEVVEMMLLDLNKKFDVVYLQVVKGIKDKKSTRYLKGEFKNL